MTTDVQIAFSADVLHQENEAMRREWLVTNGIGGYASSSLAGANTRRYHGLLVAALDPPLGRAVLLSKLDETLVLTDANGTTTAIPLSANRYADVTAPQGFALLESWEAFPAPRWTFAPANGVRLQKTIQMAQGHNQTLVSYVLLDAPAGTLVHLELLPLVAWRDYHSEMHRCDATPETVWNENTLRLLLPNIWNVTDEPLALALHITEADGTPVSAAAFAARPDWYYRFQHPRERERGQDCEEDLFTPGTLRIPLAVGKEVHCIAAVGDELPMPPQAVMQARTAALEAAMQPNDPFLSRLTLAAGAFRVQVPGKRSTLIAGYPWFADWGRDTMIALPGICLATGQTDMAREILLSFAASTSAGMLPNRFPDIGEVPEYNTVDATLWYFVAIYRYVQTTGDLVVLHETLWPVLEQIVDQHLRGTRYGIRADAGDGLLYAGQQGVQLTWMDAKVGEWVVTPRIGKPVEINALWCNVLAVMADFAAQLGRADRLPFYAELAQKAAENFRVRFPRSDGRGLYDVLDTPPEKLPDAAVRPNQIFAVSLPFAPLEANSPAAASVVQIVLEELLTPFGLRTLSPKDPAYRPRYEGDAWHRDGAYHQGTVWPWLLGAFAEAHFKVHGERETARNFLRPLESQLSEYGVGSLAEIYDGAAPQRPNGCIAQAWSVGEILRVWQALRADRE